MADIISYDWQQFLENLMEDQQILSWLINQANPNLFTLFVYLVNNQNRTPEKFYIVLKRLFSSAPKPIKEKIRDYLESSKFDQNQLENP